MHRFFFTSSLLTIALALPACGGITTTSYKGKDSACQEQCEEMNRCDSSVKVDECAESCRESKLTSQAGQQVITDCLVQRNCGEGDALAALDCIDDGAQDIPTSAEGEAFCGGGLDAQAECSESEVKDADRKQCKDWISLFSDEALKGVNECFEKSCDAMGLCLLTEFANIRAELDDTPAAQALTEQLDELLKGLGSPGQ